MVFADIGESNLFGNLVRTFRMYACMCHILVGFLHGDALELRVQQCPRPDRQSRCAARSVPHMEEGILAQDGLYNHGCVRVYVSWGGGA